MEEYIEWMCGYCHSPIGGGVRPHFTPRVPNIFCRSINFQWRECWLWTWYTVWVSLQRRYASRAFATSFSYGSPSSLPESALSESSSKQPLNFPNHNFPSRRSFMSKPVYPLMFHNPISDQETTTNFQETLTELQEAETSPDPATSSRRDGFRWSNASSYDTGFEGENLDISDTMEVESLRSADCRMSDQKCEVCGKFLWQKSPWSLRRIMKSGDLPVAGVLPCCHVFHADCLDQITPKSRTHDPPCPVCLKIVGATKEPVSISEPLEMALRSIRRRENMRDESKENGSSVNGLNRMKNREMMRISSNGSVVKNRIGKHLSFKGKMAKDLFSKKMFRRAWSSSSSSKGALWCQILCCKFTLF